MEPNKVLENNGEELSLPLDQMADQLDDHSVISDKDMERDFALRLAQEHRETDPSIRKFLFFPGVDGDRVRVLEVVGDQITVGEILPLVLDGKL